MQSIDRASFDSYLQDHLAASVSALQLIRQLTMAHQGSELGELMLQFEPAVASDQAVLHDLMSTTGGVVPIRSDEAQLPRLSLFEALERLTVAFAGRRTFWQTLAYLSCHSGFRPDIDFTALAWSADAHLGAIEPHRLDASFRELTLARAAA